MFNSIHVCSTWLNSLLIDWISASCKCVERLLELVVPPMQQEQREIKANLYSLHHQDSITQQLYNNNNTHTASPSLCGLLRAVIICAIVFYYSPQTPASLRNPSIIQWFRSRANKSSFSFKDFSISLFCPSPLWIIWCQYKHGAEHRYGMHKSIPAFVEIIPNQSGRLKEEKKKGRKSWTTIPEFSIGWRCYARSSWEPAGAARKQLISFINSSSTVELLACCDDWWWWAIASTCYIIGVYYTIHTGESSDWYWHWDSSIR
jgi:hypothetical protein